MTVLRITQTDTEGVRRLTLNRPERANALDAELGDALLAALEAAWRDGTRVLVLEAQDRNFSGGFDFTGFEEASEGDLVLRFLRIERSLQLLRSAPFASIACVKGAAFGAGADLVAACTFRLGSSSARFRFPGYRFGVALGTRRLAALVGERAARDILVSGRIVAAEEAAACGLLTGLVEDSQIEAAAAALTQSLAPFDGPALAALLSNTAADGTGDREMAELARSVMRPGLHERIRRYRRDQAAENPRRC